MLQPRIDGSGDILNASISDNTTVIITGHSSSAELLTDKNTSTSEHLVKEKTDLYVFHAGEERWTKQGEVVPLVTESSKAIVPNCAAISNDFVLMAGHYQSGQADVNGKR